MGKIQPQAKAAMVSMKNLIHLKQLFIIMTCIKTTATSARSKLWNSSACRCRPMICFFLKSLSRCAINSSLWV